MSPRIWINSTYGLRVSKPGFNVTTATEQQLAFDSSRRLPWLYARTFHTVAGGSPTSPEIDTFNFPETLSELPIVFVHYIYDAYNVIQMGTGSFTFDISTIPSSYLTHHQVIVDHSGYTFVNRDASAATFLISIYRID